MDPLRIAVRVLFAYVTLLFLVRVSGKRTVRHGTAFDFTLSLVLGDLVDNAVFAEVPFRVFAVAAVVLVSVHIGIDRLRDTTYDRVSRSGVRTRQG